MEKKFLLALLLLLAFSGGAQTQDCYERFKRKAWQSFRASNFKAAVNHGIIANNCPDAKKNGEIDRLISRILDTWVDSLEQVTELAIAEKKDADSLRILTFNQLRIVQSLKEAAVRSQKEAEQSYLLFYSSFVADKAVEHLKNGAQKEGLALAFHALDTLRSNGKAASIPPIVKRAFGQALFLNLRHQHSAPHRKEISKLAFSRSGSHLLATARDSLLSLWQYEAQAAGEKASSTLGLRAVIESAGAGYLLSANWSKSNDRITYSYKSRLAFTANANGRREHTFSRHTAPVVCIQLVAEGKILTASRDGTVLLWDHNGKFEGTLVQSRYPIIDLQVSDNGQYALARTMKDIYYFKTTSNQLNRATHQVATGLVHTAALSPDGSFVLTSQSFGNQVDLWTYGKTSSISIPRRTAMPILHLKIASDSKHFLLGYKDGVVQLYLNNGQNLKIQNLSKHGSFINQLEFEQGGSHALSVSLDPIVRLVSPNGELGFPKRHQGRITTARFSPLPDNTLLTTSLDGTAKLWLSSGELIMDMDMGSPVHTGIFSPDGKYIIAGLQNGSLIVSPTFEHGYHLIKQGKIKTINPRSMIEQALHQFHGSEKTNNHGKTNPSNLRK